MSDKVHCPKCGAELPRRNPAPTVDVLVYEPDRGVLLVERRFPPPGWALPGGFVEYGESCETAAVREAKEETGLSVVLTDLLGVYSRPDRDPRGHTMTVVYVARARDLSALAAGDDAGRAVFFPLEALPQLAFDHAEIVADFVRRLGRLAPSE